MTEGLRHMLGGFALGWLVVFVTLAHKDSFAANMLRLLGALLGGIAAWGLL